MNYYKYGSNFEGFMISYTNEDENDYNAFCTDNYSTTSDRPTIIINYNPESEEESNNTIGTANPLGLVSLPGNDSYIKGVLSSSSDVDYYVLTPPRHGRIHVVITDPSEYSSGKYVYTPYNIEIVDETGKAVTTTTFSESQSGKTLTFTALNGDPKKDEAGGTYLVISTNLENAQNNTEGLEGQKDEYTGNYFTIRYLHLSSIKSGIKEGTIVKKGDTLGYMGSTGNSSGVHLHF